MEELERLVISLETGDLSLEQSLQTFERGIELTRLCQKALDEAEQKVRILSGNAVENGLEPFENDT